MSAIISKSAAIVFAVAVSLIMIIWLCRVFRAGRALGIADAQDQMTQQVVPGVDWWLASHFIMFFALTAWQPQYFATYIALGGIWECVEYILCCVELALNLQEVYFYFAWKDVVANTLGVLAGYVLRIYLHLLAKVPLPGAF